MKRFCIALVLAFLVGTVTAEVVIAADERSMQSAVRSLRTDSRTKVSGEPPDLTFTRRWPASFSKVEWTAETGFRPVAIFSYGPGR
ncbi:MAG: hypothetical protein P8P71_06520 [Phycisphaerales bacterium]|nr:hypothetical protein [Phycisphaerales bacterium]